MVFFFSSFLVILAVVVAAATAVGEGSGGAEYAANVVDTICEREKMYDKTGDGETTMKETTNSPNDKDTTTRRFCSENIALTWKILLNTLLMIVEHFSSCFHCCYCYCCLFYFMYTHTHLSLYIYIYVCIYIYNCVSACMHACEYMNQPCDYFSFILNCLVFL